MLRCISIFRRIWHILSELFPSNCGFWLSQTCCELSASKGFNKNDGGWRDCRIGLRQKKELESKMRRKTKKVKQQKTSSSKKNKLFAFSRTRRTWRSNTSCKNFFAEHLETKIHLKRNTNHPIEAGFHGSRKRKQKFHEIRNFQTDWPICFWSSAQKSKNLYKEKPDIRTNWITNCYSNHYQGLPLLSK